MSATGLRCMQQMDSPACFNWLEAPQGIHGLAATVFNFLFGGMWTEAVAAFVGYVALVAYLGWSAAVAVGALAPLRACGGRFLMTQPGVGSGPGGAHTT